MKKLIALYSILVMSIFLCYSQDSQKDTFNYYDVETIPLFNNAKNETENQQLLHKYVIENIKYPVAAKNKHIQGKVYLKFIIDKTGKVTNVEIIKGVETSLDNEAVRVVKGQPNWKPGMSGNSTVNVEFQIPINFKLN